MDPDKHESRIRIMLATRPAWTAFVVAVMFTPAVVTTAAMAEEQPRVSITTQNTKAGRDAGLPGKVSENAFDALVTSGERHTGKRSQQSSKSGVLQSAVANGDFWFYSADVVLFNDHDLDGHFHGVDLLFDADTFYSEAEVYAVAYLSLNDGPWNEYFATDNFTLFATSADDDFNIVTELVSGYPTGSYDLLIELFDAYDDTFLASYGPLDTSELAFLPLEDSNRDAPQEPPVVVVRNGGGSLDWLMLVALLVLPLLGKLGQERTQQAILRVELSPQSAKNIEPARVSLDDVFGAQRPRLADNRHAAPFFGKLRKVDNKVLPTF
jgi:hypothetical protein